MKSINLRQSSKRRNYLGPTKNINKKNRYKRKLFKKNKVKGKSEVNTPKKSRCWLCNEEWYYSNKYPKKKRANIKMF